MSHGSDVHIVFHFNVNYFERNPLFGGKRELVKASLILSNKGKPQVQSVMACLAKESEVLVVFDDVLFSEHFQEK